MTLEEAKQEFDVFLTSIKKELSDDDYYEFLYRIFEDVDSIIAVIEDDMPF